ncbi:MAG TPA: cyclic nucleotide-binding domain-containing protein, partial [Thermoanaerobaculia bacterium]|nr:cyclic nucleotide-binding domain-containing protein [Thermoanaerobaculia bacterium]
LYVISTGELVASVIAPTGDQTDLRTFGTGQVIGDSALLEHRPWPADFRARTRSIVLKLDPQGLEVCLTGNPDPRGFLEVLRREHNDQAVLHMVASMEHR